MGDEARHLAQLSGDLQTVYSQNLGDLWTIFCPQKGKIEFYVIIQAGEEACIVAKLFEDLQRVYSQKLGDLWTIFCPQKGKEEHDVAPPVMGLDFSKAFIER